MNEEINVRKRINTLDEIYDGNNLLINDFVNLDLSNIDLSSIPVSKWEGCFFDNTSFKNTGIKFIPNKLKGNRTITINNCDFSDNDLTYLKQEDFTINKYNEVDTYGCDFTNTGINFLKTLINVKLDISYNEYDFDSEYWKRINGSLDFIDLATIIKNPHLNIPSVLIMDAISWYVRHEELHKNNLLRFFDSDLTAKLVWSSDEKNLHYIEDVVKKCEQYLKYDKQGYGKKFYNKLKHFMSICDKFEFFMLWIKSLNISNVDFEDIPGELLRCYTFYRNRFENIVFNNSLLDLLKINKLEHFLDVLPGYKNTYLNVSFPNIRYDSWQENYMGEKRISESAFTFFNKVYLELSRTCNANCTFCRNRSFDKCEYNLDNIKNTLYMIKNYVNAVVIGGGEPTIRLNDVKILREYFKDENIDFHMFTNGSNISIIDDDYIMDNFKINLSRHSVDDYDNARIFRLDEACMMGTKDIERLNLRNGNVTLNATCFKGGLDTFDKIIKYIYYAKKIGCKKVLIQDLQKSVSLGKNFTQDNDLCIDSDIFFNVINYLRDNGFRGKEPIYATGGYVSYVFTDRDKFSVSIQKYISQNELDEKWPTAIKKTFDLSIAPNGDLYENWNQTSGMVKVLKINTHAIPLA